MNEKESKGSSATIAMVIVAAVLLLAVPCLLVVAIFVGTVFLYQAHEVPAPAQNAKPTVQTTPVPPAESPAPAEPATEGE